MTEDGGNSAKKAFPNINRRSLLGFLVFKCLFNRHVIVCSCMAAYSLIWSLIFYRIAKANDLLYVNANGQIFEYTYADALYMVWCCLTTLGYTDGLEPVNDTIIGRILWYPFAFFGISFMVTTMAVLGDGVINAIGHFRKRRSILFYESCGWLFYKRKTKFRNRRSWIRNYCIGFFFDPSSRLSICIITVLLSLFLGASIFVFAENLTYWNALYYSAQIVTVVVYGVPTPVNPTGKFFTVVFSAIGIMCFTQLTTHVMNFLQKKYHSMGKKLRKRIEKREMHRTEEEKQVIARCLEEIVDILNTSDLPDDGELEISERLLYSCLLKKNAEYSMDSLNKTNSAVSNTQSEQSSKSALSSGANVKDSNSPDSNTLDFPRRDSEEADFKDDEGIAPYSMDEQDIQRKTTEQALNEDIEQIHHEIKDWFNSKEFVDEESDKASDISEKE